MCYVGDQKLIIYMKYQPFLLSKAQLLKYEQQSGSYWAL